MDKKTERYVINILREGTLKYWGRSEVIKKSRKRRAVGVTAEGLTKWKWFFQCNKCKKWFGDEMDLEVDHIDEVGPYNGVLHEYAERMYNFGANGQALCIKCHKGKTSAAAPNRWKRKTR